MKTIRLLPSLGFLLAGCLSSFALSAEPVYKVRLTMFDFYNDDVQLTIDGRQIYAGHLKAEPSTGFNMGKTLVLHKCSDIVLVSTRANFNGRVCLKDSTKGLFVSSEKPYVEFSDREGPALD